MSLNSTRFYNRDLSWLRFNHRVLQEAADHRNPLYERLKFLAIFSSNLDEFFKVRVSNIRQIKKLDKAFRNKLITKPNKLLKQIKKEVFEQQERFGEIYKEQILPELEANGISILSYEDFNNEQAEFALAYYKDKLASLLSLDLDLDKDGNKLFIENEELYLISQGDDGQLIWVKIPEDTSRFIIMPSVGGQYQISFIDDILKYVLSQYHERAFYCVKLSRDAELYIENEYSGNLLEKIENSLSNRDTGQFTRVLIDAQISEELINLLAQSIDVNDTDIVWGGRYHNFKDFFGFPNPSGKDLSYESVEPKKQEDLMSESSLFNAIKAKDRLLYFPYESFDEVIRWVNEAAEDPNVKTIKMTLYRVSKDSAIAKALKKAVESGKNVVVFIETKARFDEANNIKWGKTLSASGAHVIYSYPAIKVHSKIMYMERQEGEKLQSYAYIGTGNFNEKTSRIYTDLGLMTAKGKITKELAQVFQVLEGKIIIPHTKRLLISPFSSRSTFIELIQKEIAIAESGRQAYITLKMNSLQDQKMIKMLYKASNAGVQIRLLIRGICCLVPGIVGQSTNITVTSIVDRFLEHARVYIFGNDGDEKMYIGSADWMTRNLDHRIEVITPILDQDVFQKIKATIDLQNNDQVKARYIGALQQNEYVGNHDGLSSQMQIYHSI